ncbi:UNVERIFIED_CONTAM: hypothetical protein FKN15_038727 [Acipenser sinensis]
MDNWVRWNPNASQTRWDGGLEDLLGGLEDQGWCLACRDFRHKVVCYPFQVEEKCFTVKENDKMLSDPVMYFV